MFKPFDAESLVWTDRVDYEYRFSDKAANLSSRIWFADLHADSLMWKRDIRIDHPLGDVSVPKMKKNRIALQLFLSVVEAPNDIKSDSIAEEGDQIRKVALVDAWPLRTLISHPKRAEFLAEKFYNTEKNKKAQFFAIRYREELMGFKEKLSKGEAGVAGILGIEGAHGTGWTLDGIRSLSKLGYRTMSLAHYTDTPYSGSSSGLEKGGLTKQGKQAIKVMEEVGILVDVAHMSDLAIQDTLAIADKPVFATHVGVKAVCNSSRNLSDQMIHKIAGQGGVIGIGFFQEAQCSNSYQAIVDSIVHVRNLVGAQYVALGSGWDIGPLPIKPSQLPYLVDGLFQAGLSETEIEAIMGGNIIKFFSDNLPLKPRAS